MSRPAAISLGGAGRTPAESPIQTAAWPRLAHQTEIGALVAARVAV